MEDILDAGVPLRDHTRAIALGLTAWVSLSQPGSEVDLGPIEWSLALFHAVGDRLGEAGALTTLSIACTATSPPDLERAEGLQRRALELVTIEEQPTFEGLFRVALGQPRTPAGRRRRRGRDLRGRPRGCPAAGRRVPREHHAHELGLGPAGAGRGASRPVRPAPRAVAPARQRRRHRVRARGAGGLRRRRGRHRARRRAPRRGRDGPPADWPGGPASNLTYRPFVDGSSPRTPPPSSRRPAARTTDVATRRPRPRARPAEPMAS